MKFTEQDLTVYHNDKPILRLNGNLAERQGITKEALTELKRLHCARIDIEDNLQTCRMEARRVLLECWTDNQFALQRTWGFTEDVKFHRFWDIDGCGCPQMDNNDAYPTGYYVVSGNCRIHGS